MHVFFEEVLPEPAKFTVELQELKIPDQTSKRLLLPMYLASATDVLYLFSDLADIRHKCHGCLFWLIILIHMMFNFNH